MVRLCDYGAGNDILCATSGRNCDMGKDRFSGTGFFSPKKSWYSSEIFWNFEVSNDACRYSQGCTDSSSGKSGSVHYKIRKILTSYKSGWTATADEYLKRRYESCRTKTGTLESVWPSERTGEIRSKWCITGAYRLGTDTWKRYDQYFRKSKTGWILCRTPEYLDGSEMSVPDGTCCFEKRWSSGRCGEESKWYTTGISYYGNISQRARIKLCTGESCKTDMEEPGDYSCGWQCGFGMECQSKENCWRIPEKISDFLKVCGEWNQ